MSGARTAETDDRPDLAGFRGDGGVTLEIPETMDANPEPEDAPAPNPDRPLSARERIMQAAVERANEVRERELAQAAIYDEDAREAGLMMPSDDEPGPAAQVVEPSPRVVPVVAPTPEPVVHVAPQPQLRTVTLDGHQYTVTEEQFGQLANLGMVANAAMHGYQAPQPPKAPEPEPLVNDAELDETVRLLQYGEPGAAKAALAGLITHVVSRVPQAPPVDTNAIVTRAVIEAENRQRQAGYAQQIQQEYADIFENPQRQVLAGINVNAIVQRNAQTGRRQSDLEIYREAGNMVRDAMGLTRPAEPPSSATPAVVPTPVRTDVLERKRNAPRATQAIDMRAPTPQATRAPTGSEIVNRMRVSRGLAPL